MTTADELIQESMVQSRKSIRTGLRAWISPEGKVHPLRVMGGTGPTTHPGWIEQNEKAIGKHVVRKRAGFFRTVKVDKHATMQKMMKHGWIKKNAPNTYETGRGHVKRAVEHFRSNHPNKSEVKVTAHHADGSRSVHKAGQSGPTRKWSW
jgi:hypothetical protein|tara:strand:+ start:170 stop:619 length:450 start_codon:yes stop_codon:yes gene_type:complete